MEPSDPTEMIDGLRDKVPPETSSSEKEVETPPEVEKWVDETKGVERVISVAISTSTPRTAEWIADEAVVSENTARDHLKTFSDLGVVASFTSSGVTLYHADEAFIHYREVSRLSEQKTEEELAEEADRIEDQIEEIKTEYDVQSPDELRERAGGEDVEIADIREYKKRASDLETLRDRLAVIKDAVRYSDKFHHASKTAV